jgi:hypothetical protein
MSKATLEMIEELGGQIEAAAGPAICDRVMAGADTLTVKSSGADTARWVQGAVDRMDTLLPELVRVQIMEDCGVNCAHRNSAVVDRAVARRQKHGSEEAFLTAEIKKPMPGTRLERDGDALLQTYTPRAFSRPMRCFCALVKDLPSGESMSQTYCHCSKAFVQTLWEAVLGRPVNVELLESAVSGSSVCRFRITSSPGLGESS